MAKVLIGDPDFEQKNLRLLRFAEDLKESSTAKKDLIFRIENIPRHRIENLESLPPDLEILYSLIGEFQISHESGYAIFDFFLPESAEIEAFLSDWTSEDLKDHGLINKNIFGVEHINRNIQNLLFYDVNTFEIGMLIPNSGKDLVDILRIELNEVIKD